MSGDKLSFKTSDLSPLSYVLSKSTVASAVRNSGNVVSHGGSIVLDARSSQSSVVNSTGVIEASTTTVAADGTVRLLALGGNASVTASGVIDAGTKEAVLEAGGRFDI